MAYDLQVRRGREQPELIAQIDFHEIASLCRLLSRTDSAFLQHIAGYYDDLSLDQAGIELALNQLLPLLPQDLRADEKAVLHKLVAALSFAKWRGLDLLGLAD